MFYKNGRIISAPTYKPDRGVHIMEYIIKNAKIATMDKENPFAESAIVKDGKFVFCGAQSEAEKLVSAETEVLD